jgi:predicted Zn-dependent protease
MKTTLRLIAAAAIYMLAWVPAAHSATLDVGAGLGIVTDLFGAAKGLSEKDEIAVGRDLAGQTLGAAPLVNDRAVQVYVNRVGRWIATQSERPDLPWRFGVIDTTSINAFAAPGGYILITRGLYDLLENEAQLAGILGHEIGHVVRRHHVAAMQQGGLLSAAQKGAQAYAQQRGGGGAVVGNLVVPNVAEVFARGLDKGSEFEADQLGVVLAARAGYSSGGLQQVLRKLQARGASDETLKLLFATHPHPNERLERLGDARVAALPQGLEPAITTISASAGAARAGSRQAVPAGARALAEPEQTAAPAPSAVSGTPARGSATGAGALDPAQLLRGLFGR